MLNKLLTINHQLWHDVQERSASDSMRKSLYGLLSSWSQHIPQQGLKSCGKLKDCSQVDILLITVEPESVPEAVRQGLLQKVEAAVPRASEYIAKRCF